MTTTTTTMTTMSMEKVKAEQKIHGEREREKVQIVGHNKIFIETGKCHSILFTPLSGSYYHKKHTHSNEF